MTLDRAPPTVTLEGVVQQVQRMGPLPMLKLVPQQLRGPPYAHHGAQTHHEGRHQDRQQGQARGGPPRPQGVSSRQLPTTSLHTPLESCRRRTSELRLKALVGEAMADNAVAGVGPVALGSRAVAVRVRCAGSPEKVSSTQAETGGADSESRGVSGTAGAAA